MPDEMRHKGMALWCERKIEADRTIHRDLRLGKSCFGELAQSMMPGGRKSEGPKMSKAVWAPALLLAVSEPIIILSYEQLC